MELLSAEQRSFYNKYSLVAVVFGVCIFLVMKFAVRTPDTFFAEIYPDLKALICVNIFVGLYLSERKKRFLVYFARLYVLTNFALFGFFTGCWMRYLSVMNN